jgi:hypothetical protein
MVDGQERSRSGRAPASSGHGGGGGGLGPGRARQGASGMAAVLEGAGAVLAGGGRARSRPAAAMGDAGRWMERESGDFLFSFYVFRFFS